MSSIRINDEYLKEFVEENSTCSFRSSSIKRTASNRRKILQLTCGCGVEFEVEWVKFNRSDGKPQRQCRKCGIATRGIAQRITDEEYTERKREAGIEIEHLEPPIGRGKGIRHRCPICGDKNWKPAPANVLAKLSTKCKKCQMIKLGGHNKLNDEAYQWQKLQKGIEIVNTEPYIDSATNILHKCPDCGRDWNVNPLRILSRNSERCEPCSYIRRGKNATFTPDDITRIIEERGAKWICGEYTGQSSILTFQCECGRPFEKAYSDFRFGWTRCNKCAMSLPKPEYEIKKWLDSNNVTYTHQRKFNDLRGRRNIPFSYDFSIDNEEGNPILLIEYDGEHHFKPMHYRFPTERKAIEEFERVKRHDQIKNDYAKKNNIPLMRLKENQYRELDILLKHLL